jgi:large subunit ribosomal protein L23
MNTEKLMSVLIGPLVSEKITRVADSHYVFAVQPQSTKSDIKQAVELMFKVQVAAVQVCRNPDKIKYFRNRPGRRAGMKKAYVRLKPGFNIEFGAAP